MDEKKQPGIFFENIILKDLKFSRSPKGVEKPDIDIEFKVNSTISEDKNLLIIEIFTHLKDKKESFELDFAMIGRFGVISDKENMSLDQFIKVNGPALMVPYIRETISNITMRSGLKPVIIPPINIVSMVQNQEKAEKLLEKE